MLVKINAIAWPWKLKKIVAFEKRKLDAKIYAQEEEEGYQRENCYPNY